MCFVSYFSKQILIYCDSGVPNFDTQQPLRFVYSVLVRKQTRSFVSMHCRTLLISLCDDNWFLMMGYMDDAFVTLSLQYCSYPVGSRV
jgi:hypothetical protein